MKAIWTAGGSVSGWICSSPAYYAPVLKTAPRHFKDTLRIASARLFNLQSKNGRGSSVKSITTGQRSVQPYARSFNAVLLRILEKATTTEEAQQDKLQLICDKLQLQPGMRVLDIGCGWGGLARFMAKNYGVNVVGVTISAEQQKMAQERCLGLDVDIRLQDYRDLNEQFDRIVSVGMFEHVGPKNYKTYFEVADRNLKPEGIFLLHTIGSKRTDNNVDPGSTNISSRMAVYPLFARLRTPANRILLWKTGITSAQITTPP